VGYQSDPVARFMFLYNILLQLNNDRQQEVDNFIRREVSDVSQSPSPLREGRDGDGLHTVEERSRARTDRNHTRIDAGRDTG
jgi:hypothetical protein